MEITIKAGEVLAKIEAMKMENVLKAERDCVVDKLLANPGESLSVDQQIIAFRQESALATRRNAASLAPKADVMNQP